jgi:hypothetical protein
MNCIEHHARPRLGSTVDDDGDVGRRRQSSTGGPIHSPSLCSSSRVARSLAVTMARYRLPICLPVERTNPNAKEADMNISDYAIIHKSWNGIEIEIRWNPDHLAFDDGTGMAHLEIESIKPARAPLPMTETGYRSHFTPPSDVYRYGGAEAFVDAWLRDAAQSAARRCTNQVSRQLALF